MKFLLCDVGEEHSTVEDSLCMSLGVGQTRRAVRERIYSSLGRCEVFRA